MNQFINTKTAMKRLQFGTAKCVKLHLGKSCNSTLCKDLYDDRWKVETVEDTSTGKLNQEERFVGPEMMGVTQEQVYLGDVISVDGKQTKNVKARKKKGLGTINQIMDILQSVFFGKYQVKSIALSFIVKF